ncbi:MAG: acyl-CoA dehydrogenase family protein [Ilumatobacteraceae bacterium]
MEDLDAYRLRARAWLADNMPRIGPDSAPWEPMNVGEDDAAHAKELQKILYSGGYTGICYPAEYGGQGLEPAYQRAFTEESLAYEMPLLYNVPTLSILAPTILEFGSEEQKQEYLRPIFAGETLWVQFLSEPSGGSDLAGAITSARRDGEIYVLNGSKIWSSYAYFSDYALCLARTNWEATKHRGLSMFVVKIHQPGVTVERIKQSNGGVEFCQEYFDDVSIPAANLIGTENDGWTVASRMLFHERSATGGMSPYISGRAGGSTGHPLVDLVDLVRGTGQEDDATARQHLATAHVYDVVQAQLIRRVTAGIRVKALPEPSGSLLRLMSGVRRVQRTNAGFEIGGLGAVSWPTDDEADLESFGAEYVFRQAACLGGGSTEMQRNIISERVLGMPREYAADKDRPFGETRRNPNPTR